MAQLPDASRPRAKAWSIFALKAFVTVALLTWLSRSGVLQLSSLRLLGSTPLVAVLTLGTWLVVSVLLSTSRWRVLLRMLDVQLSFGRACALQLMALFFNGVVPGNLGGDVMKNLSVSGKSPRATRKALLVLVLVERLVGLSGLVAAAALLASSRSALLWGDPRLRLPLAALAILVATLLLGPLLLLMALRAPWVRSTLLRWAPPRTLGRRVVESLELIRAHQGLILETLAFSILIHGTCIAYFTFLTGIYGDPTLDVGHVALLFPLGILSVVLPVSLAGLGVGHVAFEHLFQLIGSANGANIFNLYVIGQLAPSLLGAIPWLLETKKSSADSSQTPD